MYMTTIGDIIKADSKQQIEFKMQKINNPISHKFIIIKYILHVFININIKIFAIFKLEIYRFRNNIKFHFNHFFQRILLNSLFLGSLYDSDFTTNFLF